ncbi:copper-binding protein [Methylobacterium sp. 092160098-2]|uniref:copper-binding protein n=1 Tax=Methylobacterium sp. 092160098-2 TaxID=3025129 RepID=UPI00406C9793
MSGTTGSGSAEGQTASCTETVVVPDVGQATLRLNRKPISALRWAAMEMALPVAPPVDLMKLQPGTKVEPSRWRGIPYPVESTPSS